MSENENQQSLTSSLCKTGCGFFGSSQFDGMCSVCYKENLKKKQKQDDDQIQAGRSASPLTSNLCASSSAASALNFTQNSLLDSGSVKEILEPGPLEAGGQPTIPVLPQEMDESPAGSDTSNCDASGNAKPKKNRCGVCKKKVGLTGFTCRCDGLYCSLHRYSDKHDCQFDYQSLGQQEIRKANPQVVSSKVDKL